MKALHHAPSIRPKQLVALGFLLAGILATLVVVQAKDTVPFKARCAGQLFFTDSGVALEETGVASHTGAYRETGTPVDGVTWLELEAANGDCLHSVVVDVAGELPYLEVTILIINGTGRFEGATGSYIASLTINPLTLAYTATATGTISTVGSNKK